MSNSWAIRIFRFRTFPKRISRLFQVGLALALAAMILQPANAQSDATELQDTLEPPNIVFIFADDLGYGDIGAFGADDVKTPHIDSLATNGAKLTQFYSASPVCTPSRAALLTGRYPVRMGIHHVFFANSYAGMPQDEVTIAEILKPAGYATGIVGKWHLGHHEQFLPINQGFDEFFGIPYSNDMTPLPYMRGNDYAEPRVDQTQMTKRLTEESISFIERHKDQPFFLYLAHPMPHVPIYTSGEFEGSSKRGPYGDVIEELDWSVGEVLATLDHLGLTDNTLVVFTSDNGPWLMMGVDGGSNGELRDGKGTTFEGGVRVPTVAQLPGTIPAGQVIEHPATMLDWLPTLMELTGAAPLTRAELDGESILPLLKGQSSTANERPLFHYSHGKIQAIRIGNWKYKREYDTSDQNIPGIIRLLMAEDLGLKSHEAMLFNLAEDPGEKRNLIKKNAEKAAELEAAIAAFESGIGETPANITPIELEVDPATQIMMQKIVRALFIAVTLLLILAALLFYWLGRRRRRRAT